MALNSNMLHFPTAAAQAGHWIRSTTRAIGGGVRVGLLLIACALCSQLVVSAALGQESLNVDVLVADQGAGERNLAYRMSLDSLLLNVLPIGTVPELNRSEVLRSAGDYVQSFRYRRVDPALPAEPALATVKAREPDARPSLLTVTFPAELAELIQTKLAPEELPLASEPEDETILALIAVDQQGSQMLIGGKTGVKFQNRAMQLAAASDLEMIFPRMDDADREALGPADVLNEQREALDLALQRYSLSSRLTGALIRLASGSWQSEWRFSRPGAADNTYRLTTSNLDEALVTIIGDISDARENDSGGSLDPLAQYGAQHVATGVALRIDNIVSLADYHQVFELVRGLDEAAIPETLQANAVVFRLPESDSAALQQQLVTSRMLAPFSDPASISFEPGALSYRYSPR